jgi:hypothetical protein
MLDAVAKDRARCFQTLTIFSDILAKLDRALCPQKAADDGGVAIVVEILQD